MSGRDIGCEGVGAGEPIIAFVLEASIESKAFLNGLLSTVELAGSVGRRKGLSCRSIGSAGSSGLTKPLNGTSSSFLARASYVNSGGSDVRDGRLRRVSLDRELALDEDL